MTLSPASPTGRGLATAVVRRLRDVVAWDEPWDYEDDDVIDPEPAATSVGV